MPARTLDLDAPVLGGEGEGPVDPNGGDEHHGGNGGDDDGSEEDLTAARWYQPPSAVQAVAMAFALLFFGAVIGWALGSTDGELEYGGVDRGFLHDMTAHHEQAVEMGEFTLRNAEHPSTVAFASEVMFFQSAEIGIMQRWLQDARIEPPDPDRLAMTWMSDAGHEATPVAEMPGMVSQAGLDELRETEGLAADELFYRLMIPHHLGGVAMAEFAAEHAETDAVRRLARVMADNQLAEIAEYRTVAAGIGIDLTGAQEQ